MSPAIFEPNAATVNGVIVVDKPSGWTSHDVVAKMRGIAGTKRVGHLGTLDPIATGVLPLMIGHATRLARFWNDSEKAYDAVIRFGFATSTCDRAGEPCGPDRQPELTAGEIEPLLANLRGVIRQTPPPVSAKKIHGVPAYKLARRSVAVDLAPVEVAVYELTLLNVNGSRIRVRVRCSPGTYVRSIAHDLGQASGYGAHVEELVRTQSGPFIIQQAYAVDKLQLLKDQDRLREAVIPLASLLPEFPCALIDEDTVARIRQGRDFNVSPFRVPAGVPHVKAIGPDGTLVAIGRISMPHLYHPVVVLPSY